jgi:hypothetical protein
MEGTMKRHGHGYGGAFLTMVAAGFALGASGCMDYTIETSVHADGTGTRVERMEVTRNSEFDLSESDFRALTLSGAGGWTATHRVDGDGDTTRVLERRQEIRRLAEWSEPPRRTLILGSLPTKAGTRLGYVRLGDVAFRSSVQVSVSRRSDGTSLVSYRESFLWDQAADALVEFFLRDMEGTLKEAYPRLSDAERAAILGFARSRIWVAGDQGLFFGENEDPAIAEAAARTAEHAVKIVRVRYPEATSEPIERMVTDLLKLEDDGAERLFTQTLPGLNLGFNTEVRFRLTLPGTVTTDNADRKDGKVLEWTFSPLDNLTSPLEVFAEAVVGR